MAIPFRMFSLGPGQQPDPQGLLTDATWIAVVKELAAGSINLLLAFVLTGVAWPPILNLTGGLVVGFLAYGISLVLFVIGLRRLGTARTGAYFSIAPFIGAVLAVGMGEPLTLRTILAGIFMAVGVLLHLTEGHAHFHAHELLEHEHRYPHMNSIQQPANLAPNIATSPRRIRIPTFPTPTTGTSVSLEVGRMQVTSFNRLIEVILVAHEAIYSGGPQHGRISRACVCGTASETLRKNPSPNHINREEKI